MILSLHSIAGAVLASNSKNIGEAIVIGLASHYFFDSLPHIEYKIEHIKNGNFKIAVKELSKIAADLAFGLLIILYLIQGVNLQGIWIILTGALFAIIPDGLVFLNFCVANKEKNIFTKFLAKHALVHSKIHSSVTNKIIASISQIIIIAILAMAIFIK